MSIDATYTLLFDDKEIDLPALSGMVANKRVGIVAYQNDRIRRDDGLVAALGMPGTDLQIPRAEFLPPEEMAIIKYVMANSKEPLIFLTSGSSDAIRPYQLSGIIKIEIPP